jgi:hypothetical protein
LPGVVERGEDFCKEDFLRDLGQLLYKYKATLEVHTDYFDNWDEDGYSTIDVTFEGASILDLGECFPIRRKSPSKGAVNRPLPFAQGTL